MPLLSLTRVLPWSRDQSLSNYNLTRYRVPTYAVPTARASPGLYEGAPPATPVVHLTSPLPPSGGKGEGLFGA